MMAIMNMEGEVLKWMLWKDSVGELNSWSEFMEDMLKRFGQGSYAAPVGKLSKLIQTNSVKEYQTKFEEVGTKIHGMLKVVMKEVYIYGLKYEVQTEVLRARPSTVNDAFDLARIWEEMALTIHNTQLW